tara:strand:+ start:90883 stop:92400 length:1518 start_codon:yes stop_codon:yes gene_type:complete
MLNENLLDAISLLYYQSHKGSDSYVTELCRKTIEGVKIPEGLLERDSKREILLSLKTAAEWALDTKNLKRDVLLKKLSFALGKDMEASFKYIEKSLVEKPTKDEIDESIRHYKSSLQSSEIEKDFRKYLSNTFNDTLFNKGKLKVSEVALAIQQSLDKYARKDGVGFENVSGVMGRMSMQDADSVKAIYDEAQDESSDVGILKLGWKGVNRMFGWHNGLRRGDMWMVAAMQHQWKTGFTLNMARHLASINVPNSHAEGKKPLMLHVSSENALTDNALLLYQGYHENETGEPVDIRAINPDEASKYVIEKSKINGFNFDMLRVNPSDFTFMDLFALVEQYEQDGYEIYSITFDYLNMISKKGCMTGAQGMESRDLFRRVRNYMAEKKILFITPHQIASDAKNLLRMGVDDLVKELKGKSYWDSCRTLDQEVDGILICHIEFANGVPYYTIQLEKHRRSGAPTPEEHRYVCYRMHVAGAVRDDYYLDTCTALSKVGDDIKETEEAWF